MTTLPRPPSAHADYRPDIDGLRAVAVLSVVVFHASPTSLPGGFAGVDIFFVISGFLITGILLRSLAQGRFSIGEFYARRIRRIFPALIAMLLGTGVLAWALLLTDEFQVFGKHVMSGAGFAMNLTLFADTKKYFGAISTPLIHLWSLGVEEQFYLFWPLFLWGTWKLSRGRLGLLVAVAAASFVLNALTISSNPLASFYLPSSRLWELSIGGVLAYLQQAGGSEPLRRASSRLGHARGAIGALLLLASFIWLDSSLAFPGWWALAPSVGALMLISAGPSAWVNRRMLGQPLMVYVGRISYPLYLWHWPLLSFAHSADWRGFASPGVRIAVIAASFVLAALTYHFIEMPIRRSPHVGRRARDLCIGMAACAFIGFLVFTQRLPARFESKDVGRFAHAATEPFPYPDDDGVLKLGDAPRRTLFIGDSTMAQYYPRIAKVLAEHPQNRRSAVFTWRAGCASEPDMSLIDTADCEDMLQQAAEQVKDPRVDTVVLGYCWYVYFTGIRDPDQIGRDVPLVPATERALANFQRLVASLVQQHKRVIVMLQTPVDGGFAPRQMIRRTVLSPGFQLDVRAAPRGGVERVVTPFVSRLREIARVTGAEVIDPLDWLCNERDCPAVTSGGDPIYRNTFHLREYYVRDNVRFLDPLVLDADSGGDVSTGRPAANALQAP